MKWHEKKELMICSKSRLKELGIKINVKDIKDVEYLAIIPFGHVENWTIDVIRVTMKNGDEYIYLSMPERTYSARYKYKLLTASTEKKEGK